MELTKTYNLLDVDKLVEDFLSEHEKGIATLHKIYYKSNDKLSLRALTEGLKDELKTGCITFINKRSAEDELGTYLFYIANSFCKKNASSVSKRKTEYLCPGCLYLGTDTIISYSQIFKCEECKSSLNKTSDPKKILLYGVFAKHNKAGYHCPDCTRFIPHPIDNAAIISCPYFDCYFAGTWSNLKKMHHPTTFSNVEKLTLDIVSADFSTSSKDNLVSNDLDALSKLQIKDELQKKVEVLKEVIESQSNNVLYNSSDFTVKHKLFTYQAFADLINQHPEEMVDYLLNGSRSGGFQHKIFQEYIKLLEAALPFVIKKNGKIYRIESLLDDNMCVFDGISIYDAMVTDKTEIKNNTQEFYIGGRKASYTKPYYMGKLLNVVNKKTNTSILNQVEEYSFSKIKLKDVKPGTMVTVTHLRIPPHYQMGGMVYVNRIRKKIIDKALTILNRSVDE